MADNLETRVPVVFPDGDIGTIDASELKNAEMFGYRPATEHEIKREKLREKYGEGAANVALAALTSAAESMPFVGGLAAQAVERDKEAREARKEFFPGVSFASEAAFTAAQFLLPTSPAKALSLIGKSAEAATLAKGLSMPVARAVGGITEGTLFGVGRVVNEAELGDTQNLGERLALNVGAAALIGGMVGYGSGKAEEFLSSIAKKEAAITKEASDAIKESSDNNIKNQYRTVKEYEHSAESTAKAESAAETEITIEREAQKAAEQQTPKTAPTSSEGIRERIKSANLRQYDKDAAEYTEVSAALNRTPPTHKPNNFTLESLKNPAAKQEYQYLRNGGTQSSSDLEIMNEILSDEAVVKYGAVNDLENSIKSISPGSAPAKKAMEAGKKIGSHIKGIYDGEVALLKPGWEYFKNSGEDVIENGLGVVSAIERSYPGISEIYNIDNETGKYILGNWVAGIDGYTKRVHSKIRDIFSILNKETPTIRELYNVRKDIAGLITNLEGASRGKTTAEISALIKLKSELLTIIDNKVASSGASGEIKELFLKTWKNEDFLNSMQQIIGGNLKDTASLPSRFVESKALDKIFRNENYIRDFRKLIGEEKFKEVLADFLNVNFNDVKEHVGHFSSRNWLNFLDDYESELITAFEHDPQKLQAMRDYGVQMKYLPDAPSINPSATSKPVNRAMLETFAGAIKNPGEVPKQVLENIKINIKSRHNQELYGKMISKQNEKAFDEAAAQEVENYSYKKMIENAAYKTQKKITSGVNLIVRAAPITQLAIETKDLLTKEDRRKEYDSIVDKVKQASANPEGVIQNLSRVAEPLSVHAPMVSQALQSTAVAQASFLASKLPPGPNHYVFSPKQQATDSQIAEFLHYYRALDNPMVALQDIKTGTLTKQTVEAIANVYPSLYKDMSAELLNRVLASGKEIPYQTKLMISMFVNQPLDISLQPQSILSNQQSLAAPSVQQNAMPQQGVKPTQKGLEKLGVADRILTPMQKSQQRRE